ncbi:MAG TPA: VWA domain-containing protein [Bacteroidales bacterium]|nr:VWA domain-containing protein [Bacteroidales bacterium]
MSFVHPEFLLLIILVLLAAAWYIYSFRSRNPVMIFPLTEKLKQFSTGWKRNFIHVPFVLNALAAVLLIIVLARPQSSNRWKDTSAEGIDIMLTMDISGSMLAEDFKPNRLEAGKRIAAEFIAGRKNDRIGLVVFSAESFTQCPVTTDHVSLVNLLNAVKSGMIQDGTALGDGLATAVGRLKESTGKSKVIILLTDGVNNTGSVDPVTAGELARTFHIRVYTIGIGTMGNAPYPVQTPYGVQYQNIPVEIDEPVLRNIADLTGGKYFRATDNEKLRAIYHEIDQLEKTKVEVREYARKEEEYTLFAAGAFLLLVISIGVRLLIIRTIP